MPQQSSSDDPDFEKRVRKRGGSGNDTNRGEKRKVNVGSEVEPVGKKKNLREGDGVKETTENKSKNSSSKSAGKKKRPPKVNNNVVELGEDECEGDEKKPNSSDDPTNSAADPSLKGSDENSSRSLRKIDGSSNGKNSSGKKNTNENDASVSSSTSAISAGSNTAATPNKTSGCTNTEVVVNQKTNDVSIHL